MEGSLEAKATRAADLTYGALPSLLFWKLPAVAMVAVALLDVSSTGQALVWAPGLLVFSAGCIANALGCRRVHCYFTGPFFFLMAAVSLLHGLGVLSLGEAGWTWIELTTLIGAVTLAYVSERVWGRYWPERGEAQ